ncbi:MAG: shikimate kinase [Clostridia bacterium]
MILNYEQFIKTIPNKKTFVLFGNKLTHSISSNIHSKIFKEYDLDAEYFHVELKKEQLCDAINHLKKHYCGANVTIPYKTDVMEFLDECDEVSSRLNSVNTILVKDGKTFGYNTDIIGIYESLAKDGISLKNKKVALLGYGGTANVVADILAKNGADTVIFGRDLQKASKLQKYVLNNFPDAIIKIEKFENFSNDYELIFNTTPFGMNELEGQSPIDDFSSAEYVFDCVYNPQITKIIDIARNYGIKSRSGLNMLYTQALFAQHIWFDFDVTRPNDIYDELSSELFIKRLKDRNIVLFGFMGCGKTTVSNLLASETGLNLVDTDTFIEKMEGEKVSEIFATKGEPHFRVCETKCAEILAKQQNNIISTGGGFVIDEKNVEILAENSVFVFIDTTFEEIFSRVSNDPTRPLSKADTLKELFDKRYPIYSSINALTVSGAMSPEQIVDEIIGKV